MNVPASGSALTLVSLDLDMDFAPHCCIVRSESDSKLIQDPNRRSEIQLYTELWPMAMRDERRAHPAIINRK